MASANEQANPPPPSRRNELDQAFQFGTLIVSTQALHFASPPLKVYMKLNLKPACFLALVLMLQMPARAAFTSLYIFGDSLSTTAINPAAGPNYYGLRWSNGRVWVEIMAQYQGLAFNPASNTISWFGNTSSNLFSEVNSFKPPTDASNALVVVWVNNADLFFPATDSSPTLAKFNAIINQAQTNHYKAITNLYAKGIRTLVMPNVVDISTIPLLSSDSTDASLFHQSATNYNAAFTATLNKARNDCRGLTIISPDFYTLLNNLLVQSADYGVTNALQNGHTIDVLTSLKLTDKSLNGSGTNYIFWNPYNPTAKVHYIMANVAQQMISPVQVGGLVQINGSNQVNLVSAPVGMAGVLENCTNLAAASWTAVANFTNASPTQSVSVVTPPLPADFGAGSTGSGGGSGGPPTPGSSGGSGSASGGSSSFNTAAQFYRVRFPYNWVWP
jgi:phospholipase/lecithinase/hemolysin